MSTSGSPIVKRLKQSRLIAEKEFQEAHAELSLDGKLSDADYVSRMVSYGLLTAWQGLQLLTGRQSFFIGPYKLLERVGHGGMAAVFKAQHVTIGRIVALKVFPAATFQSKNAAARFRRETDASVRVNHPHVVSAYGSKFFDGRGVLMMEFVHGDDFARWLKRCRPLPVDWCCEAIRQAAIGLTHIHQRGLVHRDIKPSNLLAVGASTGELPHVKVADLGAAIVKYSQDLSSQTQLTTLGSWIGTPNYMSPEQLVSRDAVDCRSDVFSLGCTLFKLLADELPWPGETLEERVKAKLAKPPARIRSFRKDATPRLEQLLDAMLDSECANRPSSAEEVASELAAAAPWRGGNAVATGAASSPSLSLAITSPPSLRIRRRESETVVVPPPPAVAAESPHEWRLLRESVQGPPETFVMRKQSPLVVGRGRDCHVRVRDLQVSRRHCQFVWHGAGWQVEDLASQNGTHVNGQPIKICALNSGDQISIGSTRLWLVAVSAVESVNEGSSQDKKSSPRSKGSAAG